MMDFAHYQATANNFTKELQESEIGEKTTLAFIKNIIPSSPLVNDGESFQVMTFGGTNFFKATITKNGNSLNIAESTHDTLPLLETKEIFFTFLEKHLDTKTRVLAINFGYPIAPVFENGKLDGQLIRGVKEHEFKGLVGEKIGAEFEKYMAEKGQTILVSIANDTICLLLSGKTKLNDDSLAAGIVGTGMNFAISLDATTLVNLEAGAFGKFERTPIGLIVDEQSSQKGVNIFEKELSGGFLFQHFNLLTQQQHLSYPPLTNSEQLSDIAEKDTTEIGDIARDLMKHSASLVACIVTGIANFKEKDMTFVMIGSMFWKGYKYKETVEEMVKKLSPEYSASFIEVENSDLLGAAKLVA